MPKSSLFHARERAVWAFAAFYIASAVLMLLRPYFTNASEPVRGITDPVLALQMARSPGEVEYILADAPSPDREVMRIKQYEDFFFIAAYLGLLLSMAIVWSRRWRWSAVTLGIFGIFIAMLDVRENLAILSVVNTGLDRTTQAMVDAIRHYSVLKWTFGALALWVLAPRYLTGKVWKLRVTGILNVLAGVAIFAGLIENSLLKWSALFLGLAILCSAATLRILTHESASTNILSRPVR